MNSVGINRGVLTVPDINRLIGNFCNKTYVFSKAEVQALAREAREKQAEKGRETK